MGKDNGGAAFPLQLDYDAATHPCRGMTLLDYFAGQYLAGVAALSENMNNHEMNGAEAYDAADAMIAEKRRREQ